MYNMEERSPDARQKLFRNKGETRTDYIWDHQVLLRNTTEW